MGKGLLHRLREKNQYISRGHGRRPNRLGRVKRPKTELVDNQHTAETELLEAKEKKTCVAHMYRDSNEKKGGCDASQNYESVCESTE